MKDYFYIAIAAHGILMFIAWGVLLPSGAYIARYCRRYFGPKWFIHHRNIMISAAICTIIGASLGIIACESHFNKVHKIFGPILNILLIAQGILGYVIHVIGHSHGRSPSTQERTTKGKEWYRQVHRYFGPMLMLGGFANMMIGIFDHPKMTITFPILLGAYISSILIVFGVAEYKLSCSSRLH